MYWIPLLLILIVCIVRNGQCENPTKCLMPDKQEGACMPLELCKPSYDLLQISDTNSSGLEEDAPQQTDCGNVNNVTQVCCVPDKIQLNLEGLDILKAQNCGIYYPHISHGRQADLGEFPWMSLLILTVERTKKYICGGTLITDRYVLTAAHCLVGKQKEQLTIRLGEHRISLHKECEGVICSEPVDIKIEEIIIHPKYVKLHNDIALIRLQRKANFTRFITPVCLPIYDKIPPPDKYKISGWGDTEKDFGSDVLMYATVHPTDMDACNKFYHYSWTNRTHICAIGNGMEDTCSGDSGGPLGNLNFYENATDQRFVQYGVIAGGYECADFKAPSFYTRIEYFMQWITENIKH